MERKIKLIPYRVYKYCAKCPGTMEPCNFTVMASNSTITWNGMISVGSTTIANYNHQCNRCGHGETLDRTYPYIDYIEDGDVE